MMKIISERRNNMSSIINWDPFRELDDMQERMSRLLGSTLGSGVMTASPATDIYEEDGKLVVEASLPNFKDEEVEVNVDRNRLEIKAEHSEEKEDKNRNYLRRESRATSYYRQFALPEDVDADSANARFENGQLRVVFDRKELPKPKRLQLNGGSSKSLGSGNKEDK
jgi:HSP20 family protein